MNRSSRPENPRYLEVTLNPRDLEVMLAPPATAPPVIEYAPVHMNSSSEHSLNELWRILWNRKIQIGALAVLGLVAGLAGIAIADPVYRAETALELEGLNDNYLNLRDLTPTQPATSYGADTYLQTQVKIIRSEWMARRVAKRLMLAERPEFAPRSSHSLLRRILAKVDRRPTPSETGEDKIVNRVLNNVDVRTSLQSRIIELSYSARDPVFAADVANAFAQEYIAGSLENRSATIRRTMEWLSKQISGLKEHLEEQTADAERYTRSAGLIVTAKNGNLSEARLTELQTEISRAQALLAAKQSEYETAVNSPATAMPQALDNGTLRDYRVSLVNLRRQLAELSASLTPAHYKVQKVQAQIAEVEAALVRERASVMDRIREEYDAARRREELLVKAYAREADEVARQAAKAARYGVMKRELDTAQQLYDSMLQKTLEANVALALTSSNARVIDPARVPSEAYSPKPALNAAIGLFGGFFVGIAVAIARQRCDKTLKRPGDVATLLNVAELGVIPSAALDRTIAGGRKHGLLGLGRALCDSVELATWRHGESVFAESFRSVVASILFSPPEHARCQTIVVTSLSSGEGKTTVLTNLGIALAETNRRTLLIDGDLRRPRLHTTFGLCNSWGLSDLLSGNGGIADIPIDTIVKETDIPGLSVILSGPGAVSAPNLFYSKSMLALLARLRSEFDHILIDSPPALHFPDSRILGRLCDGVILVVRASCTKREEMEFACNRFVRDRIPLIGAILNDWTAKSAAERYYCASAYTDVGRKS